MVLQWGYRANIKVHQSEDASDRVVPFNKFIKDDFTFLDPSKKLYLNPWLFNGIFQTMHYAKASNKFLVYYGREIFKYSDGGICSLDHVIPKPDSLYEFNDIYKQTLPEGWPRLNFGTRFYTDEELAQAQKHGQEGEKPICIIIHGLGGGSHEPLIKNLGESLTTGKNKDKWDVMVINNRGCCRTKITSGKLFTAFSSDDIKEVIVEIRKRYPNRPIYTVGFSFGAAILSRFLASKEGHELVKASCLIGCPWDMVDSSDHIQESWSGHYLFNPSVTSFLSKIIQNNFKELNSHHPDIFNEETLRKAKLAKKTIEFDDLITCRTVGYKTALEYYKVASPINILPDIKTPSLILNSTDDPTVGVKLPLKEVSENSNLCLVETDLGGHLAFAKSDGIFWSTELAEEFLIKFEEIYK